MVTCEEYGFSYKLFIDAPESVLRGLMKTTIPSAVCYRCILGMELESVKDLGFPIYVYS